MNAVLKTIVALVAVGVMSGCATNIKNLGDYKEAPMSDTDLMPSKSQMEGKKTKVLLLESDDKAVSGVLTGAGSLQSNKLREILESSSVEIVDRSLAAKLTEEIQLSEAKGDGSVTYQGPEVADVAIGAAIGNASFNEVYVPASSIELFGRRINIPENCTYTGGATGSLKVYEVPSLRVLGSMNLKGSALNIVPGQCRPSEQGRIAKMREAVVDTIHSKRADIKNMFAPKGYVIEKRTMGNKVIFKVSVGKSLGAASQDKLTFYTLRKTENKLTQKAGVEEMPIIEGTISDQIGDDFAWVVPKDTDKAKQIRLGDFVKVVYKKGFLN
jgi:hypothetical protein